MSTRVIAIVNQKGGVGKTTTTANLGACLAHLKKKVLVVDNDPQSNLSLHFGVDPEKLGKSCYDLIMNENAKFSEIVLKTETKNLELIPASINLSDAELELIDVTGRERVLSKALEDIIKDKAYDFILIDCSPSLGLLTLNALTTANEVFITLQADYLALKGIERLMQTLNLVKERLNSKLDITGIILCMFNTRRQLSWEITAKLRGFFKEKVFRTFIGVDVGLAEAPSHGQSILTYAPKSKGAEDYLHLAEEVLKGKERQLLKGGEIVDSETLEEQKLKFLNAHTKILFIDDDEDLCGLIKDAFSSITQDVHTLNSYEQAVRYLETDVADVLVTDINLPGKDGFGVIKWVNKKRHLMGIPIVVITGVMRDKETVIKAMEMGADKFLVKPVSLDRLIRDVDVILDPNLKKMKRARLMKKLRTE